jgi:hypothetical protein
MNEKTNTNQTTKTIAIVIAGVLLASFMGTIGMMTTAQQSQTAYAQFETERNKSVYQWQTNKCSTAASCDNMRDITNAIRANSQSAPGDLLIMHLPFGGVLQQYQVDAMKEVTGLCGTCRGVQFRSLADFEANVDEVAAAFPNGIIGYNLENDASTADEFATPVLSYGEAKDIADEHGLKLFASPAYSIANSGQIDDIGLLAWWVHLQVQVIADQDTTCEFLSNKVANRVAYIEAAGSSQEGEISFQLSLTQPAVAGKTIQQTVEDCIDMTIPGDVDGLAVWFSGSQIDNGLWQTVMTNYEEEYSDT